MSVKILWETPWSQQLLSGVPFNASVSQFLETFSQRRMGFSSLFSAFVKPTSDTNGLYYIYDEIR